MLDNKPTSLDAYRNRLRASLDAARGSAVAPLGQAKPNPGPPSGEGPFETAEGDLGDARAEDTTFRQTGGLPGDEGQAPDPYNPPNSMDPQPQPTLDGAAPKKKTSTGKEQAGPPKGLKYDQEKLDKAKTVADHVMAMKPSSGERFMDWWEKEHGQINAAYDTIKEQLGHPPEPNRLLSRKEKFAALMDFGVNLIKASEGGAKNPTAVAVGATVQGLDNKNQLERDRFDQRSGVIEKGRNDALKTLGNRGDALKGAAEIDMRKAQQTAEEAKLEKEKNAAPDTIYTDQGVQTWDAERKAYKSATGADGKPLTNMKVGGRGGSAASRDSRTANEKNIEDLISRNIPESLATDIVYRRTKDPRKAWQDIYRDRRRQYASEKEAKAEADDVISRFYGNDWETRVQEPTIPDSNDPFGIRTKK